MPASYDPLGYGLSAGGNNPFAGGSGTPWKTYGPGGTGVRTPIAAANQAQNFNLGSSANLKGISDLINQINLSAQKTALQARIPNNPALEQQSSALIGSELSGQVPTDVQNLLAQQAAERGAATGIGVGSPNTNAAYLRALGLTSLGVQQQGEQNLSAADARNPAAPIFDPTGQLLTPTQMGQLNLGYLSEADRAAEERARLAVEAARGGRSPGGYGGGFTMPSISPYAYSEPGTFAYGAPSGGGGLTGSAVMPAQDPTTAWLASIGSYSPAGGGAAPVVAGADEWQTGMPYGGGTYGGYDMLNAPTLGDLG